MHTTIPRIRRTAVVVLSGLLVSVLAACGGGGPPDQTPAARNEMVGTVTGGDTTGPTEAAAEYNAKGAAGIVRTANVRANSLDYQISLAQLTGPYALRAVLVDEQGQQSFVYTVAPAGGVANITPLTSLLIAQLYGQDPLAIYGGFGTGGSVDTSRITPANLAAAQAQLAAYLDEEFGIAVPERAGNVVTSPFRAVAGDPMYDTVVALKDRLASDGRTFQSLTTDVAFAARLCLTEKIRVTVAGAATDFCPLSKTAMPRDGDTTLLDYTYTSRRGDIVSFEVRGDSVLSVRYETAAGDTYDCAGAACAALTLGAPAANGTRSVAFAALSLAGGGGAAVLDGTLGGPSPGVDIPVLPCDTNRFVAVMSDDSVIARCADPDPGGFGVGGVPGSLIGVDVSRGAYDFGAPAGSDPHNAKVSVITDGYGAVLAVQITDEEPDTYVPRRRFRCAFAGCNGITLGPVTINTDFGGPDFPFYVRAVNFADTALQGVNDDGTPSGVTATLNASLTTAYLLPIPALQYPALADCPAELLPLSASAGGSSFNACVPPGQTFVNPDNGDIELSASSPNESDDKLTVVLRGGVVVRATLKLSIVPGDFVCTGGCAGIVVSAPNGSGERTVTFSSAVFSEQFFDVAGPRTVTLGGSSLVFAAP